LNQFFRGIRKEEKGTGKKKREQARKKGNRQEKKGTGKKKREQARRKGNRQEEKGIEKTADRCPIEYFLYD
jgi:hypothetical protein